MLRIAAIGPEQVAAVAPTDSEIAAYYNANQATYGGRETRVISQAVVPTKASADAIAARARGGASFVAATAPAGFSAEDISVGPQTRAAIHRAGRAKPSRAPPSRPRQARSSGRSSPTLAGTSSRSIRSAARPGARLPRPGAEIVARLTADKRKEALLDLVTKVEEAIADGSSIAEAAAANRLTLIETPPITAGRRRSRQSRLTACPPTQAPALKAGFELERRRRSGGRDPAQRRRLSARRPGRVIDAAPAPLAADPRPRRRRLDRQAGRRPRPRRRRRNRRQGRARRAAGRGRRARPAPACRRSARSARAACRCREVPPRDRRADAHPVLAGAGKSRMVAAPERRGYFIVRPCQVDPGQCRHPARADRPGPAVVPAARVAGNRRAVPRRGAQATSASSATTKAIAAARTRLTSSGN